MKSKKYAVLVAAATSLAFGQTAIAEEGNWYGEAGYQVVNAENDLADVTMGALALTGGYAFANGIGIEAIISQGVVDEDFVYSDFTGDYDVSLGLGTSYGIGLKYSLPVSDKVDIFGKLRYTNYELELDIMGITASDSTGEIGFGAGATYMVSDKLYLIGEISRIAEDTLAVNFGLGLTF